MSLKELQILPTKRTPGIILKPDGIITIRGRSMIEKVTKFSKQIKDWVDKYILKIEAELNLNDFLSPT